MAQFNQRGGAIDGDFQIALTAEQGEIYYTLDGTDPRQIGGTVNPTQSATPNRSRWPKSSSVRLRVQHNGYWSALDEASFLVDTVPASRASLRVSEVHYHPSDPTDVERSAGFDDVDDFEFIELVNIGAQTIDLSEVEFRKVISNAGEEGVDFRFADSVWTQLGPGERVLVVEDVEAFALRYGSELPVAGQWTGQLSNGGEQISVWAGPELLQQFTYDDGWYPPTDGSGSSLEIVDPTADLSTWNLATGWRPSPMAGGSPGTDGQAPCIPGDANGDGRFDSADIVAVFAAGEYEDQTPGNSTFDEGDWNGDGDFDSLDIVFAFQAGTYVPTAVRAVRSSIVQDRLWEREDATDLLLSRIDLREDADDPFAWQWWEDD